MLRKLFQSIKATVSEYKKNNSLPGNWKLFEYYRDEGLDLINVKEEQIVSDKLFWDVTFNINGKYTSISNLNIPFIEGNKSGIWSKSKNFFTFIDSENFRNNVEFQFAFENGNLKILKKNTFGKIIVFAFFRRVL